jgi:hypothetical protein
MPVSPGVGPIDGGATSSGLTIYRPPEDLSIPGDGDPTEYFPVYKDTSNHNPRAHSSSQEAESDQGLASDEESTLSAEGGDEGDDAFAAQLAGENGDAQAFAPQDGSDSEDDEEPIVVLNPGEPNPPALEPPQPRPAEFEGNPDFEDDMEDVLAGKFTSISLFHN